MQGKDAGHRTKARRRSIAAAVLLVLGALLALESAPVASAAQHVGRHAEIVVHPGDGLRTVHPGLFGVNHRYPYGGFGMWDPSIPGVPKRFDHRFSAAGFTAMRFPGGTVANTYHWERAIGPPATRGLNVHGRTGEPVTNDFGPDEFGRFVSQHGLQAMMLANFATGTAQEAADWVEYMNAPVGTNPNGGVAWASVRAANGHRAPYGVENWEIGNEIYTPGQAYWIGHGPIAKRTRKYVFGGSTAFTLQRVGQSWNHMGSAAVSDGSADQHFQVWYPPVKADAPFKIRVGNAGWHRISDLSTAPADANVYELDPATGKIKFGDGVHGAIPPKRDVVRASYTSGPHDGFIDYYDAMKAADPSIQVGSSFYNAQFLSLMGTDHPYDFVVEHIYSHRPSRGYNSARQFHDGVMSIAEKRANQVAALRRAIKRHAGSGAKSIGIVVSEFGMSFGGQRKGPTQNYLRSTDQAVYTALELQRWMQLGVPLAGKQALITFGNKSAPRGATVLGPSEEALIGPSPNYVASSTARVYRLLTPTAGTKVVRTAVRRNPSRRIYSGRNLRMLSAVATKTQHGDLLVTIVNKARTWRIPGTVAVRGHRIESATVKELVAPSYLSFNSSSHPHRVDIRTHKQWVASHKMKLKIPPHSVMTLKLHRGPQKAR
jgi:alpha-N-arabinofuranosidase